MEALIIYTKTKIKIADIQVLRNELDELYSMASQIKLCKFAMALANHIMETAQCFELKNPLILQGLSVNEEWQKGNARVHDVRQAGFKIHQLAKSCDDYLKQTVLRVVGQAVATGHMREHAMVASDYAIKVINIKFPNDLNAVKAEREWQIKEMYSIIDLLQENNAQSMHG